MKDAKINAIDHILKNVNLSLSSKPMRVAIVILTVLSLISGLRLVVEKNYLQAQIIDIHKQIAQKNKPLMLEILSECKGNLADQEVVLNCIEDKRIELIKPLKAQIFSKKISIALWFLFWVLLASVYIYLVNRQKSLQQDDAPEETKDEQP